MLVSTRVPDCLCLVPRASGVWCAVRGLWSYVGYAARGSTGIDRRPRSARAAGVFELLALRRTFHTTVTTHLAMRLAHPGT